jgi:hypothetical protein
LFTGWRRWRGNRKHGQAKPLIAKIETHEADEKLSGFRRLKKEGACRLIVESACEGSVAAPGDKSRIVKSIETQRPCKKA